MQIAGFVGLGFMADAVGRKPTTILWYALSLVLTPVVYLWTHEMWTLLLAVAVFGFFSGGIWAWALYRPQFLGHRFEPYAAATTEGSCI
jgi:MFS family permease